MSSKEENTYDVLPAFNKESHEKSLQSIVLVMLEVMVDNDSRLKAYLKENNPHTKLDDIVADTCLLLESSSTSLERLSSVDHLLVSLLESIEKDKKEKDADNTVHLCYIALLSFLFMVNLVCISLLVLRW